MIENGSKIKVRHLQRARMAYFLYARDAENNNDFYIYAKSDIVLKFPAYGNMGDFDDFQDTCVKLASLKYFDEEKSAVELKKIDFFDDKQTETPELIEVGQVLVSVDLISNQIGEITINNRNREIYFKIMDAGKNTDNTGFDIELK